jgi:hypothetical protein
MNRQTIILAGAIVTALIILFLIILGSNIFLLLLAGALFYVAYRFKEKPNVLWSASALACLMILIWPGSKLGLLVGNLKLAWFSLFSIPFTFLVPVIILLGIWIWKRGYGILIWRLVLCVFLIMSWIAGNSQIIFDGYASFKKNIPENFGPSLPSPLKNGLNSIIKGAGNKAEGLGERLDLDGDKDKKRVQEERKLINNKSVTISIPATGQKAFTLDPGNYLVRTRDSISIVKLNDRSKSKLLIPPGGKLTVSEADRASGLFAYGDSGEKIEFVLIN